MKIFKKILPFVAGLLVVVFFAVSLLNDNNTKKKTANGFAMGSPITVTIYDKGNDKDLCHPAIQTIKFIDDSYLSHTAFKSSISLLNIYDEVTAEKWFVDYIKECMLLAEKSDCFTLFSGEMKKLWKIEDGGYVPTDDEIAQSVENLKKASINVDGSTVYIKNGILDLGALGKGTACDEAIKFLKEQKVENALVTVGGSVGAIGKEPYKIGVRNPFGGQNDYFAVLNVTDCFISTSGDYEKYFEKDGVRYSHIFDARTGKPVQNDITSVTVVADNGTLSDFLSTAIFAEGIENGLKLADEFDAEVIIVKKDKSVLVTDGLKDKLTINDNSFSISVIE